MNDPEPNSPARDFLQAGYPNRAVVVAIAQIIGGALTVALGLIVLAIVSN
jgi:hypothetical protein